eukprot:TRINITY_DN3437_c0_g1_i12.p2 TRINITY_DN3437_c0_g1~~TRINITY_DN3437_c0_g1_i12.p2  ORF type:complete len:156 (-),score=22.10 TRINITY_DN3437_c0_g1_i12:658-1125(-)
MDQDLGGLDKSRVWVNFGGQIFKGARRLRGIPQESCVQREKLPKAKQLDHFGNEQMKCFLQLVSSSSHPSENIGVGQWKEGRKFYKGSEDLLYKKSDNIWFFRNFTYLFLAVKFFFLCQRKHTEIGLSVPNIRSPLIFWALTTLLSHANAEAAPP